MTNRNQQLLTIRPVIASVIITDNMSDNERFQNVTLRPIIKLQNDLFIAIFRNYITKHKNVFYELTLDKRLSYIDKVIHKDINFRSSLRGVIIGQFTTNEYLDYVENASALNKRMMTITIQRLQSSIQLFENP